MNGKEGWVWRSKLLVKKQKAMQGFIERTSKGDIEEEEKTFFRFTKSQHFCS